jgi:hypothetical protein
MPRPAALLPALLATLALPALVGACAAPIGTGGGGRTAAERDPRADACRAEATRVVQFRERGQTMRSDETESGRGTFTVAPYSRAENDRALAQIDRDRLVADCLRAEPPRTAAGAPAGATAGSGRTR